MKKFLARFLKYSWNTVKWTFTALLLFTASLFFREQRIPRFVVEKATAKISTREFLVKCDSAAFGFRRGLRISGIKVYDLRRENSLEAPVGVARMATANVLTRDLHVSGAEYRRLPDSYYEDTGEPPQPPTLDFDLPEIPEFTVTLENPVILGVAPKSIQARILCEKRRLELSDVRVAMPDRDKTMKLEGDCEMDLDAQTLHAELAGEVAFEQVRPFVEVMDVPVALPYVDGFAGITEPIPTRAIIDVGFPTGRVAAKIDVRPTLGSYNGVPMDRAEGVISFSSEIAETNRVATFDLKLPLALDHDGRRAAGDVHLDDRDGRIKIALDVKSNLRFADIVRIADVVPMSVFDGIVCDSAPSVTLKGTCGTSLSDIDLNDFGGRASLRHGSVAGLRVNDLEADYSLKGDVLNVKTKATGKTGGDISGDVSIFFEGFDPDKTRFAVKASYKHGSLEELADVLDFDLGDRNGTVDWDFDAAGLLGDGTNEVRTLNGSGKVTVTDGHLAQMKLFAGLTELLAEKIPGVSFLVNQTQASADYTITNGVFASDSVYIEGGLVSIKGWGKYDIAADDLDFTVRAQFLKKESMVGKIIHPVTLPFTKLLLEFKVDGPIDDPKWRYIKILDRIL